MSMGTAIKRLKWEQVCLIEGKERIHILKSKTGKQRIIPLSLPLRNKLKNIENKGVFVVIFLQVKS